MPKIRTYTNKTRQLGFVCVLLPLFVLGCARKSVRDGYEFRSWSLVDQRAAAALDESQSFSAAASAPMATSPTNRGVFTSAKKTGYWDVSLQEVVQIALSNSSVLRDLGGRLVSQPNQAVTVGNPELIRSDTRAGIDAALAAFDGQWKGVLNYGTTENGLRNPIVGSPIDVIQQQKGNGSIGVSKIGRSGTRYSITQGHIFDADNVGVPPGRFPSAFDTFLNIEGRQPIGRGGGRFYNAIAGPNSQFGTYNGYWIASIRGDIAEDELQIALRDYLYNVQRNYWLLRFSYDNVKSRKDAYDLAKEMLKVAQEKLAEGSIDETVVLQAKEKYFAAQQLYDTAIEAPPERVISGILGPNGALVSGSAFSLQSLERRLRLLIGIPSGQGGFLRPTDSPAQVPMQFDYDASIQLALSSRPELRRQTRVIEQRRMEYLAARNLRLPSIDLVGQYRVHGFGQQLFGDTAIRQNSSLDEFLNGNLQDLGFAIEVVRPAGNRLAMTAERNAMVSVVRESNILNQQRLEVSYEVESGLAEVERSQKLLKSSESRLEVAREINDSLCEKFENGIPVPIENILEAKKAITELELSVAIAKADYSIALASLAVARGTLLTDLSIYCGNDNSVSPALEFNPTVPASQIHLPLPMYQPEPSIQPNSLEQPNFQDLSSNLNVEENSNLLDTVQNAAMEGESFPANAYLGFPTNQTTFVNDQIYDRNSSNSNLERVASPMSIPSSFR